MMMSYTDIENRTKYLRNKAVVLHEKKVLIAKLGNSEQEKDLTLPVNCCGYGRIHHFRIHTHDNWTPDPLPNLPMAKALKQSVQEIMQTQIFQIAVCNFHCWYCFVDEGLRIAEPRYSAFLTAETLIDMFLKERNRPDIIDLSGGQPDLIPEWTLWIMEALEKRDLSGRIFLWSDDNLSTDNFWKFLTPEQISYISNFPNYSRVGCFKGYDEKSFVFNTGTHPSLFRQQFEIFKRLLKEGFDMYAYVTFTSVMQPTGNLLSSMNQFVDRLQTIHPNLPLRTVPLKIESYTPTQKRIKREHSEALKFQYEVLNIWLEVINT
jgi:uncharacterized Fe-S cluster-containing radical SAM superfamily protein